MRGCIFELTPLLPHVLPPFSIFPLSLALPPFHCGSNQTSLILCFMDVLILAENRKRSRFWCLSCKGLAPERKQNNSSEPSLFEVVTDESKLPRPHTVSLGWGQGGGGVDARRPAHGPTFRESCTQRGPQRTGRRRCNCTCASVPSHQKAKTASAHQQLNGFTKCGLSAQQDIIWP